MLKYLKSRWIPLIVTAALCLLGISLGNWQTRRALEKEGIAQELQARSKLAPTDLNHYLKASAQLAPHKQAVTQVSEVTPFQQVQLRGEFVQDWPLYLDNRPMFGIAGFYVVMPFKLAESERVVLVVRGWVQRNVQERSKLPPLVAPTGLLTLHGVVRDNFDRSMQLGEVEVLKPGAIVQNLRVADFKSRTGWEVWDKVVEQNTEVNDGLSRRWPSPATGADKHRGYAFQWYGLALMAALFFLFTGFRRQKNEQH